MDTYPLMFEPIYKEKIWGGRNLQRLFDRALPGGANIGESWELADLPEGVSVIRNGPAAGETLTGRLRKWGRRLLGEAAASPDPRFPLLLKLLDANDMLSLQVHPDEQAVAEIGPEAVLKTECWYILESRDGYIYKGVEPGVTAEQFRRAIETNTVEQCVRRVDVTAGDFHYLPAGVVHAIGPGVVLAEVQTPSDTTYRVTDWGRGREIHVERSLQCIRFDRTGEPAPGAAGETLLVTEYFTVARRAAAGPMPVALPAERCAAVMILEACGARILHEGAIESSLPVGAGDTVLLPATLRGARLTCSGPTRWLEITLPEG